MTTTFPNSPRLLNGALVGLDPLKTQPTVIIFQYNPDTLTRTLTAQTSGENPEQGEVLRLKGPPQESIRLEIEIDAADQLEKAFPPTTTLGLYPALAALELLLYPASKLMIANETLLNAGIIEVIQPEAPLTVFAWGINRVLPVRLTQFTITEEAFDPQLNPLRAKVSLDLRVLSYHDLGLASRGGALHMVHHVAKESLAKMAGSGNSNALRGTIGI
jgi:hypothetical protein